MPMNNKHATTGGFIREFIRRAKAVGGTQTAGSTAQNVNVTDIICEGPIRGLVDGVGSLYLNDVRVEDAKFSDFKPNSFLNGQITFSGSSATGTVSSNVDLSELEVDSASDRSIALSYFQTSASVTAVAQSGAKRTLTLQAASGTPFTSAWENGTVAAGIEARTYVVHQDVSPQGGIFSVVDGDTATFETPYGEYPITSGYSIIVVYYFLIDSMNTSTNQVTLTATPAAGTYEFSIGGQILIDDEEQARSDNSSTVGKIHKLNIDFRRGDLTQPITSSVGGVGGSIAVNGNVNSISGPRELKIMSQTLANSTGVAILDKEGLPNSDGSKTYPGSPDYSVMADSATVLTSSSFGLDTLAKIREADELGFTIKYPALQVINLNKGDKEQAYAYYAMHIRFELNGAYTGWKKLFTGAGAHVKHNANTNAPISFDHVINLANFRNMVGPFDDFQVRVLRVTRHLGLPVRASGTNERDTNKKKWQLSARSQIESLRAVIKDNLNYPYTAHASVSFSSRQFDGLPNRSYLLQGKLVKIPNTYTPREYSDTGIAKYEGFWDGGFRQNPVYTDNPAWVFYDLVTNNRYGAGKWILPSDIDEFALYRIARYCDELVDDGSEYDSTKPLKVGNFYRIHSAGDTTWSSVGASSGAVGTIFQATDTDISGTGVAYGVEPRFRANVFLTKATDIYKVLKDFATIFLGILYWENSKITAVQDSPQDPVYNFTKGNVINGAFSYQSSGSRTKANQIIVTWNDPTINYEPVPLIVEDRESIVRTGKIITQSVMAFGATSESQALRYGRWKLWTAQNQTEVVSFKTSLAAHYIRPGDVINVQDADRYGVAYSGRTKSATSTSITFDRNVSFTSGSTYELSTLVTSPAAFNASNDSVTVSGGSTYQKGEKIDSAWVFENNSWSLVSLNTEARASNAFTNNSGTTLIPTVWKPYSYVETHEISNPGSSTNNVTLANSATFDNTPATETIWALKETSGGFNVSGSEKMYKVLSISEESANEFGITAVEYYHEKFTAVEEEYELGVVPPSIYVEREPTTIPRPVNPRVVLASDAKKPGEEIIFEWDPPESKDFVKRYEVTHNIEGIDSPIVTGNTQVSFKKVPNGTVLLKVRAISRTGNMSSYTAIDYGVYDPYGENVPRMAGGIPKGVISTAQGVIDSNNHFKFQATNASVASITNPFITYTITGTKNVSNISTDEEYYLYLDTATPSLKLLEYDSTALSDLQFYRDVGTGNSALSTAWTSIGTVSVSANSNEVTGSGFNNSIELRDVLNLENSTSPSGGDGAVVIGIISDTKLLIDRTFDTAKTNITGYRSSFRPDYANDSIFAEITKSGSTISTNNFITLRSQADEIEGTTETLDDGTIAVKDGGISVDKIAANSITADKIQANAISAREIDADSINANHIVAGEITADAIAANAITADKVTANSVVATLLTASAVTATEISATNLSSISANIGDITAGTLKGGNIPDANSAPAGSESGAFLNLTGGKMVFGNASKYVLFDGTNLELNGVVIDASSTVNATATPELIVKEDGTAEITDAASLNFTSGLNVAVSGTEATISLDTPTDNNFTNALKTKLDNIEALADVTDTANVVAALTAGTNITIAADGTISTTADITGVTAGTGLTGGGTSGSVTLNVNTGAVSNGATTIPTGDHVYDFVTGFGYTTNVGDITNVTAGTGLTGGGASGSVTLNVNTGAVSNGATTIPTGDQVYDFVIGQGYTTNVGDITNVTAGTGLTGGGASGSVSLAVTGLTTSELAAGSLQLSSESFSDSDSILMTAKAINDRIESFGYTTNVGDITNVTAGTGLTGGGSSGSVTLNVSGLTTSELAAGSLQLSSESFSDSDSILMTAKAINDRIESFGYTTNVGDITGVTAGDGLSGGGSSGGVSLAVDGSVVRTSGAQTIAGNKTFSNNVTVSGDFTVSGTTTTINTASLLVEDNKILVNSAQTGTPATSVTAGIEVERGDSTNKSFVYAESGVGESGNTTAGWTFGSERVQAGTFFGTFVGDVTGTPSSLTGLTTDNLNEGINNLYFTDARAIGAITPGDGISISSQTLSADLSAYPQNITLSKTSPVLTLNDTNTNTGNYPAIEFHTNNSQDVRLYHTEFDSELPVGGYGLVLDAASTNTQYPTTGVLSLVVKGEMFAGDTTLGDTKKVWHRGDLTNTDKSNYDTAYGWGDHSTAGYITAVSAGTGLTGGGTSGSVTLNVNTGAVSNGATTIPTGDHVYDFVTGFGYTTNVGDITNVTAGTGLTGGGASGSVTLNVNTGAVSNGATTIPTGDQVYDFVIGQGYTTNVGDITNVTAGTGLTGGGASGSVSLAVTGLTTSELAANSLQLSTETFSDSDSILMTAAAINDRITSFGYTTNVGDITNVTAGTGLTGGGASGSVTLNVSTGAVSNGATTIPTGDHVYDFVTGFGYTTNVGDITNVTAGTGLTGGGTSGSVTLNVNTGAVSNGATTIPTGDQVYDFVTGLGYITNSGGTTGSTASTVVKRNTVADISVRGVRFDNKEKTDINAADGHLGFDSSQGLLIRRTQQNVTAATVTVLDGANVAAGTGLSISNLGSGTSGGGTGTEKFTFSLANTGVTANSYTNANITVDAQGRITAASSGGAGGTDLTTLTDMTQTITTSDEFVVLDSNAPRRKAASEVIDDLNIITGNVTGTLFADIIAANVITADMIQANSIVSTLIDADTISANNITTGTLDATNVTISNLQADNISGDISEIFTFGGSGSYLGSLGDGARALSTGGTGYNEAALIKIGLAAPTGVSSTVKKRPFIRGTVSVDVRGFDSLNVNSTLVPEATSLSQVNDRIKTAIDDLATRVNLMQKELMLTVHLTDGPTFSYTFPGNSGTSFMGMTNVIGGATTAGVGGTAGSSNFEETYFSGDITSNLCVGGRATNLSGDTTVINSLYYDETNNRTVIVTEDDDDYENPDTNHTWAITPSSTLSSANTCSPNIFVRTADTVLIPFYAVLPETNTTERLEFTIRIMNKEPNANDADFYVRSYNGEVGYLR